MNEYMVPSFSLPSARTFVSATNNLFDAASLFALFGCRFRSLSFFALTHHHLWALAVRDFGEVLLNPARLLHVTQKEVADQVSSMNVFYEQHKAFRVRVSSLPQAFLCCHSFASHPQHADEDRAPREAQPTKQNREQRQWSEGDARLLDRASRNGSLTIDVCSVSGTSRLVWRWTSSTSS